MKTIVVIPAFNEEATVGQVVAEVAAVGLSSVVIDDGSTDATGSVATAAGARVITMPVNVGVGGALRAAFRYAIEQGAQRVVQVDADRQHDPAAIPTLVAAADDGGFELVVGSRFAAPGYPAPRVRRLAMRILARVVSRRVGVRLDDVTSGFRVITEPLLSVFAAHYPADYLGDTVEALLLAHRNGARIGQVGVPMSARTAGTGTSPGRAAGHLLGVALAILVKPRRKVREPDAPHLPD